ncbi:RNA polymerase sigma factor [Actinotalea sp. K2]|uniref:RNA polymerase sigma factor n=1 Tax=Actinotalea sp. K2 TaxID=2939438 RepID=UPI002017943C|nr:sigma-70 family RNA polymerase sigma factor [Actinotalea sp. K2]
MALATGNPGLGEEAAAESFALALLHWSRVGAMDSPGGWVYATALNQVRRSWRRQQLEARYLQRCRPEDVPAPREPDTALWRAVAGLSARARTAVSLRYVADLSEAEIAAAMNITRGTVATTLSRARKQLAEQLRPALNGDLR